MKKIASMNFDVIDHIINDELEKVAEIASSLSNQVRTAYIPSIEELELKKDKDFAAVIWNSKTGHMRKFANYSPELTELNMAFLANVKDELPDEIVKVAGANLTKAAKKFKIEIPEELSDYKSDKFVNNFIDINSINKLAYVQKTSKKPEVTEEYALKSANKYPIGTTMELKKAASFFEKNYNKLNINDKLEFVSNVQEKAKELDVSLSNTMIEKYANLSKSNFNEDFYSNIEVRKSYLKEDEEEIKIAYDELLSRADELGPMKTAEVLEELDLIANFSGTYGKGIYDPLYSTLEQEKKAGREIDGTYVTPDQLRGMDEGVLTGLVGNDVITELKSDVGLDVLESLPKPVREDILEQL